MKKISFTAFEATYIIIGLAVNTVIAIITKASAVSVFYAYCCVLGGIMLTKARIEGYFLQFAMGILYVFIAWKQAYYGEVVNALLVIPVTAYGLYNWLRSRNSGENTVDIARAGKKEVILLIISQLLLVPLYRRILCRYTDEMLTVQALSIAVTVMAFYFCARISVLSYYCFISKDIVSTILWIPPLLAGDASAWLVIIPNLLFFINDIYGLISWRRMLAEQKNAG
ncbi:MAG: nicotinamide mononucleotide transporter [Erysipelotrichaceae bacterium]|nr:nicotinamide mononucleotide transporter [Erysipelotrichaceae bacterium]